MKNAFKSNLGFTLIELLVVVLIIGILAAIALPSYQQAVAKSRFSTIKPLVAAFAQAEESYYLSNGAYAFDFESLDLEFPGFDRHTSESCPHTNSDEYDGVCHAISNGTNALSTRGIGDKGGRGVIGQVREKNGKYGADYVFYLSNRGNPSEDHHKSGDRVCRAVCVDNSCVWYKVCASETRNNTPSITSMTGYNYYSFKY